MCTRIHINLCIYTPIYIYIYIYILSTPVLEGSHQKWSSTYVRDANRQLSSDLQELHHTPRTYPKSESSTVYKEIPESFEWLVMSGVPGVCWSISMYFLGNIKRFGIEYGIFKKHPRKETEPKTWTSTRWITCSRMSCEFYHAEAEIYLSANVYHEFVETVNLWIIRVKFTTAFSNNSSLKKTIFWCLFFEDLIPTKDSFKKSTGIKKSRDLIPFLKRSHMPWKRNIIFPPCGSMISPVVARLHRGTVDQGTFGLYQLGNKAFTGCSHTQNTKHQCP